MESKFEMIKQFLDEPGMTVERLKERLVLEEAEELLNKYQPFHGYSITTISTGFTIWDATTMTTTEFPKTT
jgi:hypothetical protein